VIRQIAAFLAAAASMVVLGSAAHSMLVQRAWSIAAGEAAGAGPAAIPLADRIAWAVHDLGGMLLPYAAVTSLALLVAFLLAGWASRLSGRRARADRSRGTNGSGSGGRARFRGPGLSIRFVIRLPGRRVLDGHP
jgi:hypothetical protein